MTETNPLCWLNGRIARADATAIHPLDRGLLFGDGVYETLRVVAGKALLIPEHLARLRRSLAAVEIAEPAGIEVAIGELLHASGLDRGSLFVQITRGVAPRAHRPPADIAPTLLIIPAAVEHAIPGRRPLRAVTVADPRWQRCDVKSTSLMGTVLGKLRARDADADEALFVGPAGELREGGSTNLFVRRGDLLETHPLDGRVLPGITRGRVLRWAADAGYRVVERPPLLAERGEWSEAFLCGTLTAVQPLAALDGEPIGDSDRVPCGPWTRALAERHVTEERALFAALALSFP